MSSVTHQRTTVCTSCGREFGTGMVCQFCAQVTGMPPGVRLSSIGRRFGGYVLEIVLAVVTLGIGWIVWSLIIWSDGYTPAKQLLKMKVVKLDTGDQASWGTMFLREVIGKWFIGGILISLTLGILNFMLVWDSKRQQIWDKVASTVVVDGMG